MRFRPTPRTRPGLRDRVFGPLPFARQVQMHTVSNAADAFFAVSLAGSLFFNVSLDAARPRIILYLALTMAPFAVIAPVIGPLIDRVPGGHRLVVSLTGFARAGICFVLAGHLKTLLFYPEAFSVLVLGKTYSVAKSALVPRIVGEGHALVDANSRLSRLGTVGGAFGGAVAAGMLGPAGAPWTLRSGALLYLAVGGLALRLPRTRRVARTSRALEREEVHAPRITLAASAMAVLRAGVGFSLFLLAFALRSAGEPAWVYGAVLAGGGAGGFVGTFVAPSLGRRFRELHMLAIALIVPAVLALAAGAGYGRATVIAAVFALGVAANVGRQAFDSLVQHDAPDADRGRVFAGFETRFQLAWALGAMLPVVARPPPWAGMLLLSAILTFGAVSVLVGTRAADRREPTPGPHVRELLPVSDASPVAVRLLLTAERLAGERVYDQAVLIAAAAVEAWPAAVGARESALSGLREHAIRNGASVGPTEAAAAISLAAGALARAQGGEAATPGPYTSERSETSHSSPTRSTT